MTTTLPEKFQALKDALETEMVERHDVIDTAILALVSGTHHFQLGSPGIAKSLLVRKVSSHIGGFQDEDYFEALLTRFSAPEELFGPYDLVALRQSIYRRQTNLMLPKAKLAFLDEIFKANAAILNALLMILNERLFRNEMVETVPLSTMFCASNELPEGEELNALYDRIHFRHILKPVQEQSNFIAMLKLTGSDVTDKKIITWDEVEQAKSAAAEVEIPDDVFEAMNGVRNDLRNIGIEPTDRRFVESLRVCRAAAWLDGEKVADIEHLRPLAHMFWTTPDEQPKVEKLLLELANPLDKQAMDLLETVDKLSAELDKVLREDVDPQVRNKKGVELHNKVDRAKHDLTALVTEVEQSKRKSAKVEEVKTRLLGVTRRLLRDVFNIDVEPTLGDK